MEESIRSEKTLKSFIRYCATHPELRFWQALRNWSGAQFVYISNLNSLFKQEFIDTYFFEGRTEHDEEESND